MPIEIWVTMESAWWSSCFHLFSQTIDLCNLTPSSAEKQKFRGASVSLGHPLWCPWVWLCCTRGSQSSHDHVSVVLYVGFLISHKISTQDPWEMVMRACQEVLWISSLNCIIYFYLFANHRDWLWVYVSELCSVRSAAWKKLLT